MLGRLPLLLLSIVCALAWAQQRDASASVPQQKCVLEGTAIDAVTGEALRKVTLRLADPGGAGPEYSGETDPAGRFNFEGFQPGDYELTGERAGYLTIAFGAERPESRGTVLHFKAGDKLSEVTFKLTRSSSLSGKVLDETGEPVSQAYVVAIRKRWRSGHREFVAAGQANTNDAGEYRIGELAPDRYYLFVGAQQGRFKQDPGKPEEEVLPELYPDSPTLENATPLNVERAQDLTGLDFHLHPGNVFHVRGRVMASGYSLSSVRVRRKGSDWGFWGFGMNRTHRDGSFDMSGIASGNYLVQAVDRTRGHILGAVPIEVKGSDVNGVVIPLAALIHVTGAVRMGEGSGSAAGISVNIENLKGNGAAAFSHVESGGEFRIEDVPPGNCVVTVLLPNPNDYVASIQYGGQEVLGQPVDFAAGGGSLDISIRKGAGQIEGSVDRGDREETAPSETKPASASTVALISDPPRWDDKGVLFARADQMGHFSFNGVPPGKYRLLANEDIDEGLWLNRNFLSQILNSGVELELPENGKLQIRVPLLAADDIERAMASVEQ